MEHHGSSISDYHTSSRIQLFLDRIPNIVHHTIEFVKAHRPGFHDGNVEPVDKQHLFVENDEGYPVVGNRCVPVWDVDVLCQSMTQSCHLINDLAGHGVAKLFGNSGFGL